MKNMILFVLPIALFFVGCNFEYDTQSVTNKSSKTVSYTMYYEKGTFQLAPGEMKEHSTPHNSHLPPRGISVSPMPYDVEMKTINGLTYEFITTSSIALSIVNTLPVSIEISTGTIEYMSVPSITVPPNSVETSSIFTKKPKFVNESKYPVIIDWNFADDTIYVILR